MEEIHLSKLERFLDSLRRFLLSPIGTFILIYSAVLAILLRVQFPDPDLFARLAVGRLVEDLGFVPYHDPFSFTPQKPMWIDHEWLSGLFFWHFWSHPFLGSGETTLFVIKLLVVGLTLYCLVRAAHIYSNQRVACEWALLLSVASSYLWLSTVRCQLFTYLFLSFLFLAISQYLRSKRTFYIAAMPFIFCVWANMHGGFVVGLGFLGILLLYEAANVISNRGAPINFFQLLAILVASIAATLITPYPVQEFVRYIWEAVTMPRPFIDEWHGVSPFSAEAAILTTTVVICFFGIAKEKHKRLEACFLIIAAVFAYKNVRLQAIFFFVALVFGATLPYAVFNVVFTKTLKAKLARASTLVCAAIIVWGLGVTSTFLIEISRFKLDYSLYPVQAFAYLRKVNAKGNILLNFNVGSFGLFHGFPDLKVSIDGRYEEVYPNETVRLVATALSPTHPNFGEALDQIDPDYILCDAKDRTSFETNFSTIYSDDFYAILKR